ncbi:MAG: bifunctional [glutamate--ammonia ligase]-adenylyl-L-tyrosine phosphorylase/[glutamate--ammonia-ligase] adenylyltransferase [Pirellulaceae bacterium]|jgi:glutamate-ammonia-ligase adenylyltransferase|nr:bifunctional [glutamate--ammonia ligase]-adenylyl-L-tyrosine phosphorylase/[glutamate--ammonia-ligase] adenylyltransferase [Pirellulaceae bacterium]
MEIETLVQFLDSPAAAAEWLRSLQVADVRRAHANLNALSDSGLTLGSVAHICEQLSEHMPRLSDPDRALNSLERFITAARNPLALASLFERDVEALPTLLQIISASQYLSDLLIRDPESFGLLRRTDGQPVARQVLIDEIRNEFADVDDERQAMDVLRRYKHRETLRIAYGDIIRRQTVDTVTRQISYLADAICDSAVWWSRRSLEQQMGRPRREDGQPARFVILALGKLGGQELNYSSDIDLMFLSDESGSTDGERSVSCFEFFQRLQKQVNRLLTESTNLGAAYRVDLRLRPEGAQGPAVAGFSSALRYYDVSGRTWERQAFVKARPIAGDIEMGEQFLDKLESWIYRRYLSRADISGIKALKRRIERRAEREQGNEKNVKTGHGGIRDVEFVIQFLQLLNGGDLVDIRTPNTGEAINRLAEAGCLTMQEQTILYENYSFLRTVEHRLQIMFDLQTHTLPDSDDELRRLAIRIGYEGDHTGTVLEQFQRELQQKQALNRKILDHLLHDAFGDEADSKPESDLVLDPDPSPDLIEQCLANYGFRRAADAYRNLMALSTERVSFLSTRRCRHFLASIAPDLLARISLTPDPDATLVNLSNVSDSLGGKGVLWELMSTHPASLELYVRLCASSPYLSSILINNPGMIDELLDSLMLDRLPTLEQLDETLEELCRGAEDIDPILHSFKDSQHLRVGVRDILDKEDIRHTHRVLSDIAEVCLKHVATREFKQLCARFGEPQIGAGANAGEPAELIILALGKLGGREPNYHSDLDVILLYQSEGVTKPSSPRGESTSNQHFFAQLGQRIIKVFAGSGPLGNLYDIDARLRPTGKSGSLACSLDEFQRYFHSGQGQLWERQALCKARPVFGSPAARAATMEAVRGIVLQEPWRPEFAAQIRDTRIRLEESASRRNLKRGVGGTVDVEFTVQMLQLRHAAKHPSVLTCGTLDAVAALQHEGLVSDDDAAALTESYRFLRSIESGLRLMNTTARHDLPDDDHELARLAFLLGHQGADELRRRCESTRDRNRRLFDRLFLSS